MPRKPDHVNAPRGGEQRSHFFQVPVVEILDAGVNARELLVDEAMNSIEPARLCAGRAQLAGTRHERRIAGLELRLERGAQVVEPIEPHRSGQADHRRWTDSCPDGHTSHGAKRHLVRIRRDIPGRLLQLCWQLIERIADASNHFLGRL
jgi:hypothetical protein